MACGRGYSKQVPLFALLDDDETAFLAAQVETRTFASRERIYKAGEGPGSGYVVVSGSVNVTTIDEDHQEVIVDQPGPGEVFGFASMLGQTPHQTEAVATSDCVCIEIDRNDIFALLQRKPHAGMDLLTVLSKQIHAAQGLVRSRAMRNANEVIEEQSHLKSRGNRRRSGSLRRIVGFFSLLRFWDCWWCM